MSNKQVNLPAAFPKDAPLLNINSPTFLRDLMAAADIKEGSKITYTVAPTGRVDGRVIDVPKYGMKEFLALTRKTKSELIKLGLFVWEEGADFTQYLYPVEWASIIPEGLPIESVTRKLSLFEKGKTDTESRAGALSFGFVVLK